MLSDRMLFIARIPMDKGADALEDRARETLNKLGYTDRPADTARGFLVLQDYVFYVLRTDHSGKPVGRHLERLFPVAAVLVSHQPARPRDTRARNGRLSSAIRR